MQTRQQFETRSSAGTDSNTLMRAEPVPARPRHSRRRLTAGLLLAFAALLALLPQAQAQTTIKMVSNGTGSPSTSFLGVDINGDYRELAQRFTSGSNPNGYTLSTATIPTSG